MKKLISVLFCLVLAFSFSFGAYADDGATEKNICYNKPDLQPGPKYQLLILFFQDQELPERSRL